jgi:hypothetical protein
MLGCEVALYATATENFHASFANMRISSNVSVFFFYVRIRKTAAAEDKG